MHSLPTTDLRSFLSIPYIPPETIRSDSKAQIQSKTPALLIVTPKKQTQKNETKKKSMESKNSIKKYKNCLIMFFRF